MDFFGGTELARGISALPEANMRWSRHRLAVAGQGDASGNREVEEDEHRRFIAGDHLDI